MADGVNIDWSALKAPDPLGDYASAFAAGRALAAQRIAGAGSLTGSIGLPAAPADPPQTAGGPHGQAGVQPPRYGSSGDTTGPAAIQDQIASMSEAQRQAASQAQEQFAAILNGLKIQTTIPYERLAMARHLASLHPEFAIDPNTITADDVSDQGLAGHIAASMSLKEQLDAANARSLGYGAAPQMDGVPSGQLHRDVGGPTSERAAFFQRAAMLGLPGRMIDPLWARYSAMHHGGDGMGAAPQSGLSDEDLIAALQSHRVSGFANRVRPAPPRPGGPIRPHTLSDQDLKTALEL
jgi:hypothetical protein